MAMYNKRMSRFKRRRFNPRKRLKVIKYPKTSQRRQSRVPAARYGLFYDMMKKYSAVKALGRPSVAQKTMQMVVSRKNNIMSSKQMKMGNFRVSRFVLLSYANQGSVANPPTFNDTNLNYPGLIPLFLTVQRNFSHQGAFFPTSYDLHTIQSISPTTLQTGIITLHPSWPGSKLHTWDSTPQGTPATQPHWGLLAGNQLISNRNYNWNTRAVENVKSFLTNTALTQDNLEILYRSIKVYKSTLTLEFFNNNVNREIDVHIVHFKYLDFDTTDQAGTCGTAVNDFQLFHNTLSGEQGSATATFFAQNNAQMCWEYCLQRKKLPPRNYITKSWKTITLGRAVDTMYQETVGGVVHWNSRHVVSNRPYRKLTFKYGTKVWTRTGCTEEGTFINDQTLDDRRKLDTQVMIFTTFNKNYQVDSVTAPHPTTSNYGYIGSTVSFRFWKTNLWREQS